MGEGERMPVYDFKCTQCGHRFELLRAISNRDAATCPKCGGAVVRVYEGRWALGKTAKGGGGCSCGGSCAGCQGCR